MLETHLGTLVVDFAAALKAVDARQPHYVSRSGRAYQPGIGPFAEDVAVNLITREMKTGGDCPARGLHSRNVICQTRTRAAPGADGTAVHAYSDMPNPGPRVLVRSIL
jgi:hypothetical protein